MTACHQVGEAGSSASVAGGPDPGDQIPTVALVGRPNTGKSTCLARASLRFVETANAPGTTVVLDRRTIVAEGRPAWLVDLPGTRSLVDRPAGDKLSGSSSSRRGPTPSSRSPMAATCAGTSRSSWPAGSSVCPSS